MDTGRLIIPLFLVVFDLLKFVKIIYFILICFITKEN
jgi:hypothetical protein